MKKQYAVPVLMIFLFIASFVSLIVMSIFLIRSNLKLNNDIVKLTQIKIEHDKYSPLIDLIKKASIKNGNSDEQNRINEAEFIDIYKRKLESNINPVK